MNALQIAGYITFGVGVILLLATFMLYRKKSALLKDTLKTQGTVKEMIRSEVNAFVDSTSRDDGNLTFREEQNIFKGDSYAPLIEFKDRSGKKIEIKGIASSPPRYQIGQQVAILYPENNPEKAVIDSFLEKWLLIVIMIGFGLILLICGLLFLFIA